MCTTYKHSVKHVHVCFCIAHFVQERAHSTTSTCGSQSQALTHLQLHFRVPFHSRLSLLVLRPTLAPRNYTVLYPNLNFSRLLLSTLFYRTALLHTRTRTRALSSHHDTLFTARFDYYYLDIPLTHETRVRQTDGTHGRIT